MRALVGDREKSLEARVIELNPRPSGAEERPWEERDIRTIGSIRERVTSIP
jgi:hypothetical protein